MTVVRTVGRLLNRFRRQDDGATAIEYAMIAVGIAVAIVVTVNGVGQNLKTNFYEKASSEIDKAMNQ